MSADGFDLRVCCPYMFEMEGKGATVPRTNLKVENYLLYREQKGKTALADCMKARCFHQEKCEIVQAINKSYLSTSHT